MIASMFLSNKKYRRLASVRQERRRKPRNAHRNRGFALNEMENLRDEVFKRMFRVDRDTFAELEELLKPIIGRNEQKAENSSGSFISVRTRLAVTLRWLAGGHHIAGLA
eukprot:gene45526-55718_t